MHACIISAVEMKISTPAPDADEQKRSEALKELILEEIDKHHGILSFEDYMRMCLYTDGLGYYTSGQEIFGEAGDFITSSERGEVFAKAFAEQLSMLRDQMPALQLIEIGAGSGRFAAQLIKQLQTKNLVLTGYKIIETSAALRSRQQQYLKTAVEDFYPRIQWLTGLDEFVDCAVIIANEVLDALPVSLFLVNKGKIQERCVRSSVGGELEFTSIDADTNLNRVVKQRVPEEIWPGYSTFYQSEVNFEMHGFVEQIAASVGRGVFFFIDYGYPRSEYYHAQRTMGTLLCHYRHTANSDPLRWPGLQDISCNVDFTALAEAGSDAGLQLDCYCTQAHFLLASNVLSSWEAEERDQQSLRNINQIKHLVMPNEMGERFQVMVFTKQITAEAHQFTVRDLRHRL